MAAATNRGEALEQFLCFTFPEVNAGVRPHDPAGVVAMQVNGSVAERAAPLDHSCVVVGVGNADRLYAAESFEVFDGGLIEKADAVPEDVAGWGLQQEGALADSEMGLDSEGDEVAFFLLDFRLVALAQLGECGPLLTGQADVLAFVLADEAVGGRLGCFGVLGAAGDTDGVHVR